jgi:propanol-preferring alcohol dehydrogenase
MAERGFMRAMVLRAPGQPLDLTELPIPEPGPGQVLVRLQACGVCHSDVHIRSGSVTSSVMPPGLILGHEGVGRVIACGEGVDPALEDRMVGMPWIHDTCQICRECLSGHESFCQFQRANGFSVHGAYAEYMLAEAAFVARIPEDLDPIAVAPLMCAGLTAYGGVRRARLSPGSRVAIFGCGGLGLYAVQIAKRAGAEVFAVDVSEAKLEQARRYGADHMLIAGGETGEEIKSAGGVDAVINFAPTPATWPAMLAAVRPLGRIVAAALVSEPVPISQDWLTLTGVEITGTSVGTRLELQDLLRMHAREPFLSELTPVRLEEVNSALDALEAGRVNGRQVINFGLGSPLSQGGRY